MPQREAKMRLGDSTIRKNSKSTYLGTTSLGISLKNKFSWRRAFRPFSSSHHQPLQLPLVVPTSTPSVAVCISCGSSMDDSSTRQCAAHSPAPCGCGQSSRSTTACSSTSRSQVQKKTTNVPSTICEASEPSDGASPTIKEYRSIVSNNHPPLNTNLLYPYRYTPPKRPMRRPLHSNSRRSSVASSAGSRRSRVIYDPTVRSLLRDGLRPTTESQDDEDELLARVQLDLAFKKVPPLDETVDPRRLGLCRHSSRPSLRFVPSSTPAHSAHRHLKQRKFAVESPPPRPPARLVLSLDLPPRRAGVGIDLESHGYEFVSALSHGKVGVTYLVRQISSGTRRRVSNSHRSSDGNSVGPESGLPVGAEAEMVSFSRRILEASGGGSSGSSRGLNVEDQLWVAKVVDLSRFTAAGGRQAELEADYLRRLRHPFIVKYRESFVTDEGSLVIIMEYCSGGDLFSHLNILRKKKQTLSEERILQWMSQLALAINYIHSKKIIHCDLKTSNIFISADGTVKVGDFGIAREIREGADCLSPVRIPRGTPIYMSPEMCRRTALTDRSDCWALGCILYEMCHLQYAFPIENLPALMGSLTSYSAYITTADLISNIEINLNNLSFDVPFVSINPKGDNSMNDVPSTPTAPSPRRSSLLRHLTRDLLQPSPTNRPSLFNLLERLYLAEYTNDSESSSSKGSGESAPAWVSNADDDELPPSAISLPLYRTAQQY